MYYRDLEKLLNPNSVAVVGASSSSDKIGNIILKNILGFDYKGKIYPVNPNSHEILGLKAFSSYSEIPETPDLAIIAIPSIKVPSIIKEIGKKGTKNVVIISAGFREIGEEGKKLEDEVIKVASAFGINIIGPNCLGFVNTKANLNTTFGIVSKINGNLRFISQSGAIATSLFDYAADNHLGFSEFITLGNKADINEVDILKFWHNDPKYQKESRHDDRLSSVFPIGIYAESINDGIEFINIASQITLENPIFMLKPGRSKAAKSAVLSHTGSLAGEDDVLDAALRDAGIIRAEGIEDFFDLAKAFSWENAPEGPNVVIITNAGGPAVISTDFVQMEGLHLAEISEATKKRLKKYLPESSNVNNPIDVLGDARADRYGEALDATLGQENVNAAIVILTPQVMTESYLTAEIVQRLSKSHKKPILCAFMGGSHIEKGEKVLNQYKIPNYRYPERAIKALGKMWKWRHSSVNRSLQIKNYQYGVLESNRTDLNLENIQQMLSLVKKRNIRKKNSGKIVLNSFEVEQILKDSKIPCPPSDPVKNYEDCLEFTKKFGWPVVLKIISPKLLHKSDIGGVLTGLNNRAKLNFAFKQIKETISKFEPEIRKSCVVQIQKEVKKGIELIVGIKKDPNFGHVMMFGAGGVLAELLEDKNLKLLPVDRFNAIQLIDRSKVSKLLTGFRNNKKYPITKLFFLVEKLSDLVINFPEFQEIEINPLIVNHEELWAVDGKGIIS